jgi:hypothetical protein
MSDTFELPGGPAFPISIPGIGDNGAPGMSLRDYFAAKALQGFTAGSFWAEVNNDEAAKAAYAVADAMLEARKK